MSSNYHLEVTAEAIPLERLALEVHDEASRTGLIAWQSQPDDPAQSWFRLHSGLWVDAGEPSSNEPFKSNFGIEPAATIDMGSGGGDYDQQMQEMVTLLGGLLGRLPGDAVFHWNYFTVWLLRRDGRLILHESDTIWRPELLAHIAPPYERALLRFPDVPEQHHLEVPAEAVPFERLVDEVHAEAVRLGLDASDPRARDPFRDVFRLPSGLIVSVSPPFEEGSHPFVAGFGFGRTSTVAFAVHTMSDPGPQINDMLSLVFGLLARVPGDALLDYEGYKPWLLRRDGRLLLSDRDDIWRPDLLARVPEPYQRVRLQPGQF